jgi:hypothetical protein
MEMKDFFEFDSKLVSSTVQAHSVGLKDDLHDRWKLVKGDYRNIDFPITFKQDSGNKLCDILDTGWASLYLISERMKKILEENNLTGWQVFPINLYDKKGHEITGYHGFSVTGHSGPTSYEKSEIIEKRSVPEGPICKYYKGVFIDNWDGTDFFTPEGTYQIYITKKAADVLKKNKITNMYLTNLTECEINVRDVKRDA